MSPRVVTVFGGTGFIGRHVIQRLAKQGATVRVATRDTEAANYLKTAGEIGQIAPVPVNIGDPASIARAINGADQVINLIGILSKWGKSTFQNIHVNAAGAIARAATDAGVKQLVHVSALGASADSASEYARTKAAGEEAVKAVFPNATILRPSAAFGPGDHFFNMFASLARFTPVMPVFGCPLIPKVKLFGLDTPIDLDLFGDGGTRLQPVYVGDVAAAITKSLNDRSCAGKTYELGGPRVYSFKAMLEMVLKESGRSRLLIPYPFALATFWAWFLEFLPKPLLTRDQVTLLKTDSVVSGELPGLTDLGIEPAAAEAILPTYLRRYRPAARRHLREA
ncbi:MAG: complex I NDUFA9 subunit family protein [Rhodospirillaceae bacterium]|nr:complex I NDUFA9 subunit family protein [Rhodospirillaceae bacterium]